MEFATQTSSESLWILVDSEQLQQNLNRYQINHLDDVLNATQFKAGFNENITLITNIAGTANSPSYSVWQSC